MLEPAASKAAHFPTADNSGDGKTWVLAKWKKLRGEKAGDSRSSSKEGSEEGGDSGQEEGGEEFFSMHTELKKMQARLETTLKQRVRGLGLGSGLEFHRCGCLTS